MKLSSLALCSLLGAAAAAVWTGFHPPIPSSPAPLSAPSRGNDRALLRDQIKEAGLRRREAEGALKDRAERFWAGKGAALTHELASIQARLDRLGKVYTPRHPAVTALRLQARDIEDRRDLLLEQDPEYQRLAHELRKTQDENDALWRRYDGTKPSDGTPASPPPERSAVPSGLAARMGWGAAAGLALALLSALSSPGGGPSGDAQKTERSAGLPVLAVMPRVPNRSFFRSRPLEEARRRLVLLHAPNSPLADACRALLAGLRLPARPGARPAPAAGFIAPSASEGKTAAALNLALTAARAGLKTLFIEADLRGAPAHRILGMPRGPGLSEAVAGRREWPSSVRGISDLLFGRVGLDAVLKAPGIENFHFLPCGAPAPPAEVLGSPRLDAILREMRAGYDLLVVDVPPALVSTDALLLAPRLDALVLTRDARASLGDLKRAKERLLNAKTPLSGLLLM